MLISYHNHTDWSDGRCSLAEQIAAAITAGIDELGISDHYILDPQGEAIQWSMPVEQLDEYVAELQQAAQSVLIPRIRLGIEIDYFPETVEKTRANIARYPFDFIIGSVHYVEGFAIDEAPEPWEPLSEERRNHVWEEYWKLVRGMAESRVCDFAAHLDLPKKFGYLPTVDMRPLAHEALDAIAAADMAIEINTSGFARPCAEAYPSLDLLREACARGIPLLINADAHEPRYLLREFPRAREMARAAGYSQLVRYEGRQRIAMDL